MRAEQVDMKAQFGEMRAEQVGMKAQLENLQAEQAGMKAEQASTNSKLDLIIGKLSNLGS
ncbi:MAG: hypothetical protein H7Z21_03565 [Hymenobacter sp.]|nr:hypothetical protein [Hymenobacter sp.]